MTTITTLEDLRALDIGTTVTVDRHGNNPVRTYTLGDDGLVHEGTSVPLDQFTGLLGRSLIHTGPMFEAGALYSNGTYRYLIVDEPGEDGYFHLGSFTDGGSLISMGRQSRDASLNLGNRVTDLPSWHATALSLMRRTVTAEQRLATMQEEHRASAAVTAEVATLRTQREQSNQRYSSLQDALSDWAVESEVDSDLRDIFDEHSISWRSMEDVTVRVNITGESEIDFEGPAGGLAGVEEMIQRNRLADWDDRQQSVVTVTWSASTTADFEVTEGDCACNSVDRAWVADYLNMNDFHYESFEFEVECENG